MCVFETFLLYAPVAEIWPAVFSSGDVAQILRMICSNDGNLSPEEEQRQKDELFAVVSYCQDTITCRRVQVLRYFGETFNPDDCDGGCNNCTHGGFIFEKDFTQPAHDAAKLTKEILDSSKPATQNHCRDVFLGLNHKEIKSRGHSELALHGAGRGLPRESVERLFSKLVDLSVLQFASIQNASGYYNLYLAVRNYYHTRPISLTAYAK
jgi:bloom syndrome protein